MKRRTFFRFAGFTALTGITQALIQRRALAASAWHKFGSTYPGSGGKWVKVRRAAGPAYCAVASAGTAVALRSDGKVYSAGYNAYGAVGDNSTVSRNTFVQSIGISNAVAVGAGYFHSAALRADGLVFTCGYNTSGQLGVNSIVNSSTYVQAIGISNASAISCGQSHTVALRSDGQIFATGKNNNGRLGDGTVTDRSTFVAAMGVSSVISVSAGTFHSAALRADGAVFTCGYNKWGQIGNNNSALTFSAYVQAVGISNAVAVSAGEYHTVALRADGAVFSCGYNTQGGLGDNTTTSRSTFVQCIGISNAIAVSAGWNYTVALRSDGLLFTVGMNNYGQIGDNSGSNRSTFVQTIGVSNVVQVAAGMVAATIAVRSDGRIVGCGYNLAGQLADGTFTNRSTFVQAVWP
jgi:alpha-tubulin suppressor-like RCC1 family protein